MNWGVARNRDEGWALTEHDAASLNLHLLAEAVVVFFHRGLKYATACPKVGAGSDDMDVERRRKWLEMVGNGNVGAMAFLSKLNFKSFAHALSAFT